MDGLRRERARRPPSFFAGQPVGGRTRIALIVASGAAMGLCVVGVYVLVMVGTGMHGSAAEERPGMIWMLIAVLCVAALAFGVLTWRALFNRRLPGGW